MGISIPTIFIRRGGGCEPSHGPRARLGGVLDAVVEGREVRLHGPLQLREELLLPFLCQVIDARDPGVEKTFTEKATAHCHDVPNYHNHCLDKMAAYLCETPRDRQTRDEGEWYVVF